MLIDKRTFANAWRLYAQIQQLSFQSFCCQISLRKIVWGDTRIWTMDLSDCSRLLYHWAISPPAVTGGGHMARGWGDKIGSRQCAHAHLPTCPPGPPCSGHSYLTPVAVAVDTPAPQRNIGTQTDRQKVCVCPFCPRHLCHLICELLLHLDSSTSSLLFVSAGNIIYYIS